MTQEQEINNLRRQAAEAFRQGNFELMKQFDQSAEVKKNRFHQSLIEQMNRQVERAMPSKPSQVVASPVQTSSPRRVWRISR